MTAEAALRAAVEAAAATARTRPWWRCPWGRRGLLACLESDRPTIRVGRTVWHAAHTTKSGNHAFTYRQAAQILAVLDARAAARAADIANRLVS